MSLRIARDDALARPRAPIKAFAVTALVTVTCKSLLLIVRSRLTIKRACTSQETFGLSQGQIIVRPRSSREFQNQLKASLNHIGHPEGFDIIMDSVAGKYFQAGYDSLAPGGNHVLFGAASYTPSGDKGKMWLSPEFWLNIVPKFLTVQRPPPAGRMIAREQMSGRCSHRMIAREQMSGHSGRRGRQNK